MPVGILTGPSHGPQVEVDPHCAASVRRDSTLRFSGATRSVTPTGRRFLRHRWVGVGEDALGRRKHRGLHAPHPPEPSPRSLLRRRPRHGILRRRDAGRDRIREGDGLQWRRPPDDGGPPDHLQRSLTGPEETATAPTAGIALNHGQPDLLTEEIDGTGGSTPVSPANHRAPVVTEQATGHPPSGWPTVQPLRGRGLPRWGLLDTGLDLDHRRARRAGQDRKRLPGGHLHRGVGPGQASGPRRRQPSRRPWYTEGEQGLHVVGICRRPRGRVTRTRLRRPTPGAEPDQPGPTSVS